MRELAEKNQAGSLSAEERADLDAYLRVGLLLDLWRAKAELSLEGAANGVSAYGCDS